MSTPTAAITGACSATSSSRKPSASTIPITSAVFDGQRLLEVVVLGRGAADQEARRQAARAGGRPCRPTSSLEGSCAGIAWTSASPSRAALRRQHARDAGVALAASRPRGPPRPAARRPAARRAPRRRRRPAPGRSPGATGRPSGTTLIDGMPVSRPNTGSASATSDDERGGSPGERAAPQALAPAREARRAMLAGVHPGQSEPCRPAGRASPARPAAASASPPARR